MCLELNVSRVNTVKSTYISFSALIRKQAVRVYCAARDFKLSELKDVFPT